MPGRWCDRVGIEVDELNIPVPKLHPDPGWKSFSFAGKIKLCLYRYLSNRLIAIFVQSTVYYIYIYIFDEYAFTHTHSKLMQAWIEHSGFLFLLKSMWKMAKQNL